MLLLGVPAVRAAEPARPRSQQVHFRCLLSAVPLFHRKMNLRNMRSCPLTWSTAFNHLRKLWAFAMGQAVPLQPPLHRRQSPHWPWRLQCKNPTPFLPMCSLSSLLESHIRCLSQPAKLQAGGWDAPQHLFSTWHRWAQSIPQQGVPQGGSAGSPQISSPSLCAYPHNFISQSICQFTRQGRVERNEWKSFCNDLRYFTRNPLVCRLNNSLCKLC